MRTKTYLMSFERMLKVLENNGVKAGNAPAVSLLKVRSSLLCGYGYADIQDELMEKFIGTWWQVELTGEDETLCSCLYLADSLQDALRLRPDIDMSSWCHPAEDASQFLLDIIEWTEDECFVD